MVSLREECVALSESSEFVTWIKKHFPSLPSAAFVVFEENLLTGNDFIGIDENDLKELFPQFSLRKAVRNVQNCVISSMSGHKSIGSIIPTSATGKKSTPTNNYSISDCESEASSSTVASTLSLSSPCLFDDSSSDTSSPPPSLKHQSTPVSKKTIPVEDRPKELPREFILPSKFGKVTDRNLKIGEISDVDRAKVIKTVATCVLVYTDTPSPLCCEWLSKQLISKYPILADVDPRSMLTNNEITAKGDFKYWHSLKKGLMKKFENWRYRENKRSPDFEEQKERKKKKITENIDSDPAAMERNLKRLEEEQSKLSKNQDLAVIKQLLEITFDTRHDKLQEISDGKTRVSQALRDWPILGKEIHFKEEVTRALTKRKVPVTDFSTIVDNWKKVVPHLMHMLDISTQDDAEVPSARMLSDDRKFVILSKFVEEEDARNAITNDLTLDQELVDILPQSWNLNDDEVELVPLLKKYFTVDAWLIVDQGLETLKQKSFSVGENQDGEIKALTALTKLFPGVKKSKTMASDCVINVTEKAQSVTEVLKKPPSTSPYLVTSDTKNGRQIFLACGCNSILETSTIGDGVAALIGAYYLFNFEYPAEAKGAYLFLQEHVLHDFVKSRPSKYAASLVRYQTAAMSN